MHVTKNDISKLDSAIIVEGYIDFLQLYQSGIKNIVAVSGTAFTDGHAHLLKRLTKNVLIPQKIALRALTTMLVTFMTLFLGGRCEAANIFEECFSYPY